MENEIKSWNRDRGEFLLFIAGIRENYPRLEIGDLVHMRKVLEDNQIGSGFAFEGSVMEKRGIYTWVTSQVNPVIRFD